jgi:beta-lactam-binding protein with PASTA domain
VASALPQGAVVSTDPAAGVQAPVGATVLVHVSTGTPPDPAQPSTAPDGSGEFGGEPSGGTTPTPRTPSVGDPSPTTTPSADPGDDLPSAPPVDAGVGAGDPTFGPDARASRG